MKILIAWELGSNWGHLATLLPLAWRLRSAGHRVIFTVRGLDGDLSLLTRAGFEYLPSPIAIAPLQALHNQPVHGYAHVLARCGFANARTLSQLVCAWHALLGLVQPDVVVCKFAPLAEFATRRCRVLAIGTGFELPPLSVPLPLYGASSDEARQATAVAEAETLQAMKTAAQVCGFAEPNSAAAAFDHVQRICLSWPALDHFGSRADMVYVGPVEDLPALRYLDLRVQDEWIRSERKVCFVYVRLGFHWIEKLLGLLCECFPTRRWLVVDPTLTQEQCESLSSSHAAVFREPVDWTAREGTRALRFDFVICHGGHGMVAQTLARRLRLILLPRQTEQLLLARRVLAARQHGVAVLGPSAPIETLVQAFAGLLQSSAPVTSIVPSPDEPDPQRSVVDTLVNIISGSRSPAKEHHV